MVPMALQMFRAQPQEPRAKALQLASRWQMGSWEMEWQVVQKGLETLQQVGAWIYKPLGGSVAGGKAAHQDKAGVEKTGM
jgi:hypothetical protein